MSDESKANPTGQSQKYRQETHVEPGGKAFVVQHGNMVVYQWKPEYRIEQYEFSAPADSPGALRAQPSRMLRAQNQVVPFDATRRHREIEHLARWRDMADETSAILLHGPGGQGKTRLANHAAKAAQAAGWNVLSRTVSASRARS
jgi:hypothetical protein